MEAARQVAPDSTPCGDLPAFGARLSGMRPETVKWAEILNLHRFCREAWIYRWPRIEPLDRLPVLRLGQDVLGCVSEFVG